MINYRWDCAYAYDVETIVNGIRLLPMTMIHDYEIISYDYEYDYEHKTIAYDYDS